MTRHQRLLIASLALSAAVTNAYAGEPLTKIDNHQEAMTFSASLRQTIEKNIRLSGGRAITVNNLFKGPDGLVGVVVNIDSDLGKQQAVGWSTPHGKAFFFGDVLVDGNENVTQEAINLITNNRQAIPLTDRTIDPTIERANAVVTALKDANGVLTGDPKALRTAYIVFDPACPHCRQLYHDIAANQDKLKHIAIKWIPVNIMGNDNMGAYILKGGQSVLDFSEHGDSAPVDPGVQPSEFVDKLNQNKTLITRGFVPASVPSIRWVGVNGQYMSVNGRLSPNGMAQLVSGQ